jgi:hypothetical protein
MVQGEAPLLHDFYIFSFTTQTFHRQGAQRHAPSVPLNYAMIASAIGDHDP